MRRRARLRNGHGGDVAERLATLAAVHGVAQHPGAGAAVAHATIHGALHSSHLFFLPEHRLRHGQPSLARSAEHLEANRRACAGGDSAAFVH